MTTSPLIIYHHACADGVAAAWAVGSYHLSKHIEVEYFAATYGSQPPDVTGRTVIMVDFSYPRDVLLTMAASATSILILDHHKTAEADLKDLNAINITTVFDMQRSGAMIAWDHFFPDLFPPLLFDHIQDRDLWQFELRKTREVTAAVYSHDLDPRTFGQIIDAGLKSLIDEGTPLLRKQRNDIAAIIRDASRQIRFGDYLVPAANVPWMYASDVAGQLSEGHPFAVTYYDDAEGRKFSLRSTTSGINVLPIAEAFGGGGHQHAAGFRMTREEAIDFEIAGGV